MRNKKNEVNIGFSKIRVNGAWRHWRGIEKEEGNEKMEMRSERREDKVTKKNRREIYRSNESEGQEIRKQDDGANFGGEARK